uniref:Uncharacterized protein n=1 Tax=Equus asinus TaxID=9793 RepID=A0A9L0ICR2_EQUAS
MLSALTPEKSCSSPSAEDKVTPSVVQEQGVTPMPPTTPRCAQDPSTEKMLLRTPGESRKETAEQEEDPPVIERQDDEGRGPDNPGEASSAFRPLGLQGGLCSIVPRPGPLQGTHHSMRSEDRSIQKSQTSCMSSCPRRNAITSSYSSTRGFPSVQRRMGPATAHTWLPQRPSEKVIPEGRGSPSAGSGLSHRKTQRRGKDAEPTPGQTESQSICSPTPDRSRPRKRKTPLLPSRHGLGFRVTVEDLASEKEAALRTIDSALRGETEAVRDHGTTQPSCSVSMPSAATAPPPAVPLAPSMTSEWGKRRKVQDTMGPLTILQTAGAATVGHPLWHRKRSSPGPLLSLSQPLPGTSSPSLPSPMSTLLTPASSPGSGRDALPARRPSALLPAPGPAPGMESAIGSPTSLGPEHLGAPSPERPNGDCKTQHQAEPWFWMHYCPFLKTHPWGPVQEETPYFQLRAQHHGQEGVFPSLPLLPAALPQRGHRKEQPCCLVRSPHPLSLWSEASGENTGALDHVPSSQARTPPLHLQLKLPLSPSSSQNPRAFPTPFNKALFLFLSMILLCLSLEVKCGKHWLCEW